MLKSRLFHGSLMDYTIVEEQRCTLSYRNWEKLCWFGHLCHDVDLFRFAGKKSVITNGLQHN